MTRRLNLALGVITAVAAIFALLLATSIPASAHHKDGHDKGAATKDDGAGSTSTPDDNDDNRHPSGKDRETNNGSTDDTEGKSSSTPDQNGKGPERDFEGTDKAGGAGGMDKDDQDGNNGCGNDDDFEDDNEGWCGNKPKPERDQEVGATDDEGSATDDMVEGEVQSDEGSTEETGDLTKPAVPETDVLGLRVSGEAGTRPAVAPLVRAARAEGQVLPFTGSDVWGFVFMAIGLVAAGYLMLKARRSDRI